MWTSSDGTDRRKVTDKVGRSRPMEASICEHTQLESYSWWNVKPVQFGADPIGYTIAWIQWGSIAYMWNGFNGVLVWCSDNRFTSFDAIYLSLPDVRIESPCISDHSLLSFELSLPRPPVQEIDIETRAWKGFDADRFRYDSVCHLEVMMQCRWMNCGACTTPHWRSSWTNTLQVGQPNVEVSHSRRIVWQAEYGCVDI